MEDHTLLTRIALERSFPAERVIPAVPLARFLADHGAELAETHHAVASGDTTTSGAFARLLRFNPRYKPVLYVKVVPNGDHLIGGYNGAGVDAASAPALPVIPPDRRLAFSAIASAPFPYPYAAFRRVEPGEELSALDVLASAADEPDYGMDLGLFSDSGTEWGREYGFGRQPFGNPASEFSTQAPFHMAFFHESPIVYRCTSALRRSFLLPRVRQFTTLARFAMERGHDYWSLRFAGWALHYVQDLTMPYHASALPGKRPATIVVLGLLRAGGIRGPYRRAIEEVTEKHVRLERVLLDALYSRDAGDLVRALAPDSNGAAAAAPPNAALPGAVSSAAVPPPGASPEPKLDLSRFTDEISSRAAALGSTADRALDQVESDPEALRRVLVAMLQETGKATRTVIAALVAGY